jgi:hypothetical protein
LWTAICPISVSGLSPAFYRPFFLSSLCLLNVPVEISSLLLPPFSGALTAPCPLCCMFLFSSLFIIQGFLFHFFAGPGVNLSRGLWFIPGVAVGIPHDAYLLTCWSAGCLPSRWELASGSTGVLLFSQCNMVWRSFVWAGDKGCQSFNSSQCFSSAKCGYGVSARFLIYGTHAVCFCILDTILDPPFGAFKKSYLLCI